MLDAETPVKGVTAGKPRPELKAVGVVARVGGGSLAGADWDVTARWGVAGKGGVCMPGKGKTVERAYSEEERTALRAGAVALGLDEATALACWGERRSTCTSTTGPTGATCRRGSGRTRWAAIRW